MAEEGEEYIVDKILDKRSRNGKIEYYLSWKVSKIFNPLFKITVFIISVCRGYNINVAIATTTTTKNSQLYFLARVTDQRRTLGSPRRISTAPISSRSLRTNSRFGMFSSNITW